jgi:hypothetical protein
LHQRLRQQELRFREGIALLSANSRAVIAETRFPVGVIIPYLGNRLADLARMQQLGYAICDGSTPLTQGITDAVLAGPTPNLTDGRYLHGCSIGQTGVMTDASTLSVMNQDGGSSGGIIPCDGSPLHVWTGIHNGRAVGLNFRWTSAHPHPKSMTVVYLILVK